MADLLIVVDQHKDWKSYYPTDNVITFQDYLTQASGPISKGTHVINLCRQYRYLSNGYYCSLLAEARGHRVRPSVRTLNDLGRKAIYGPKVSELAAALKSMDTRTALGTPGQADMMIYFGTTHHEALASLARQLFDQFPSPVLRVTFRSVEASGGGEDWVIQSVQAVTLNQLDEPDEDRFAEALDRFSRRVWRKPRSRKTARFDLAILVNPDEAMPPSDSTALKQFAKAGKALGIDVDMIHKSDLSRLGEFDGLFIRETTGIDNHTYRFARKAEAEGLMVIDDPDSILKCTNKVYLADLLARNRVATPATRIISKDQMADLAALSDTMTFPLVLKIPDGSFSRGVVKVDSMDSLKREASALFKRSSLLLVQEYMYTDYDWRIGVLSGKPIYACQYYMSQGHWQIYNHAAGAVESGDFRTMAVHEAPRNVVTTAVRAAALIGNGLYGVDLKQRGQQAVVIEVNDNPSIDSGVEDQFLGRDLYRLIMEDFLQRMESRGQ